MKALTQYTRPRNWCLMLITNPYPFFIASKTKPKTHTWLGLAAAGAEGRGLRARGTPAGGLSFGKSLGRGVARPCHIFALHFAVAAY